MADDALTRKEAEMGRIDQTEFGAQGNCQSACLAMLLGLPLAEIPNFAQIAFEADDNAADKAQQDWLRERGWGLVTIVKWQSLPWPPKNGFYIAGGISKRGYRHGVVFKDGELWHDPHPDRTGIESVDDVDILYPLAPFALRTLSLESAREEVLAEVLRGLRSENDSIQLRAIIASVEALQHAPARVVEGGDIPDPRSSGIFSGFIPPAPESPAKEQPGEQNAAPQAGPPVITSSSQEGREAGPAVAAPDVAAMVKRLRGYANESGGGRVEQDLLEAAALIEKLGHGWIPALESESKGVFLTGIPGKSIYAVDERAEPYCWWRFDLPALPPPPERP